MTSGLNYHHLLYFAAVVEEGGLVPASRRLGVSHPTVSEQIKRLESQLGLKLFERRGRRLQITQDGELVYRHASQIFGMGATLMQAVARRQEGQAVLMRVGVDSGLAKLMVRQVLLPFFDQFAEPPQLRCVESSHAGLIARLESHELDVVLSDAPAGPAHDAGTRSDLLATSGVSFFAAPDLRAGLSGAFPTCLDGASFLLPLAATRIRREFERWLSEQDLRIRVAGDIEDSGLLKALGQSGRGVFMMPSVLQEDVCAQYGVECIGATDAIEARVFAITTGTPHSNATVRALFAAHRLPGDEGDRAVPSQSDG